MTVTISPPQSARDSRVFCLGTFALKSPSFQGNKGISEGNTNLLPVLGHTSPQGTGQGFHKRLTFPTTNGSNKPSTRVCCEKRIPEGFCLFVCL